MALRDEVTNRNDVVDQEVEIMNTQMKESPILLNKLAGKSCCCIFRVPPTLAEHNIKPYRPQIVSIGPYHHGNKDLEMMQEHKWRYLDGLITRTGSTLETFLNLIVSMDEQIRESYSESVDHFSPIDLAKMMVLDGFFLIELFRKVGKLVLTNQDDPIFKIAWVSRVLMRDLVTMENQIPFFVLQTLYKESKPSTRTLPSLILEFFGYAVDRPQKVLKEYENHDAKHLLDFFRNGFINTKKKNVVGSEGNTTPNNHSLERMKPATELVMFGVKLKANHLAESFLDIEFQNGLLFIPQIHIDDFYRSLFYNFVAFEQCYFYCSKDITTYVVFMGCLMNTSADVRLLSDNKVVDYFGSDKAVAKFFNDVGKDVAFVIKINYLFGLIKEVNEYCKNEWHVVLAEYVNLKALTSALASACGCKNKTVSRLAFDALLLVSFAGLQIWTSRLVAELAVQLQHSDAVL